MVRVGVYNLYWSTYGGGEQVAGTLAAHLAARPGVEVTLLGPEAVDIEATRDRLGIDLGRCAWRRVNDDDEAGQASADFDLFVNVTYLSRAVSHAAESWYYVHFPSVPTGTRARRVDRVARLGLRALGERELPAALDGVREGLRRRRIDQSWVSSYTRFLSNSRYTAGWVERFWGVSSGVLHPPVTPLVTASDEREPLILALGRFFDPVYGHSKKQDALLDTWLELEDRVEAESWRLVLVGGADARSRDFVLGLKRRAVDHRVDIRVNAPRSEVAALLSRASVLWHAAGLEEDPEAHPDRFEHFGIAVVEAMAAGLVPMVFGAAGPAEVVEHDVSGLHWHDRADLLEQTTGLLADPGRRGALSAAAVQRADGFGVASFGQSVDRLFDEVVG